MLTFSRSLHRLSTRAHTLHVRDVFKQKEKHRWTTDANATVFDATRKMVAENVGSLVVVRHGKMVGIITERDYLRKVIHAGKASSTTQVSEIATMGVDSKTCVTCLLLMPKGKYWACFLSGM